MAHIDNHHSDISTSRAFQRIHGAAHHVDRVLRVADELASASTDDEVATSWQRSANTYGVDPASEEPPRVLTRREIKEFRDPLAKLIVAAGDELDRLYSVVRRARYSVLLCDLKGVAVDHRGDPAEADQFRYWGTWLGGVWSEDAEGTNGIGTCIADERPVTIHHSQHFRARHIGLSCSGAPIFDGDGKLQAVLDVSCIDPGLSEQSHALTGALTVTSARVIEERLFRDRFHSEWIVAVMPPAEAAPAMLIAMDQDQIIVGADRNARIMVPHDNRSLQMGTSLWSFFERRPSIFRRSRDDVAVALTPLGTTELWSALITAPRRWHDAAGLHTRPRLLTLENDLNQFVPPRGVRGGLPPRILRRVQEYVELHANENIGLKDLAATAGLSLFHFARAFKQSEGLTPHSYLLQRRIKRAQEMLVGTDLPLSQIARATGFSDQSHLARQFRMRVGVSPSTFRLSNRS